MSLSSRQIIKRVKDDFVNRRGKAHDISEERKQEVYYAVPGVQEIDRQLALTASSLLNAVMEKKNVDEAVAQQKSANVILRKKRAKLLAAAGYPEDYTDIKYACERCSDTGYVGIDMCSCMKREIAEASIEASGIGHLARTQSFENFSLDYYPAEERVRAERNCVALRDFADRFDPISPVSWLLVGDTGLGKTHLSTAVAIKVIEKGYSVVYETMQTLMDDFSDSHFKGAPSDKIEKYYDCDLLIVDDLGSELTNQFTVSVLYNIINQRANKQKSTVFSTNLAQKELREKYGDRVVSRLMGMYKPLLFKGKDIRRLKLTEDRG